MITYKDITSAQEHLVEIWGEDGMKVIEAAFEVNSFHKGFSEFLSHCTCCGGNWGGMLLSGLHELYPAVWEAVPDDMGPFAWSGICSTLVLCGVDTKEED